MIQHDLHGDKGPWLVFVHGLTCDATDWKYQIEAFKNTHRCLSVDLRGHGRSAGLPGPYDQETLAADVVALIHELSIDQAVLVGHSMGTRAITAAALQAPQRVAGLVFVDGSKQGAGDPVEARNGVLALLGDAEKAKPFVNKMFSMMFTDKSNPDEQKTITARAESIPFAIFSHLMSHMAAWDAGRMQVAFEQLSIPVGVIQSTSVTPERNRLCLKPGETTPYLDLIRQSIKDVVVEVTDNVGHFSQLDAPDDVNRMIASIAARALEW
ncbi:MAG: alpha/beta fold hydrolase [Burkholderiaceae bacterium]